MNFNSGIIKNFISSSWIKISLIIIRLIQVPILIHYLGVKDYGLWIVLSSLPSWLAVSNLGFGSVAANEMILFFSAGNILESRKVFSTSLMLLGFVAFIGSFLTLIVVPLIPLNHLSESVNDTQIRLCIIFLALSVFISFIGEIYGGRLRAAKKAHLSMFLTGLRSWFDFAVIICILHFTVRLEIIALVILMGTILDVTVLSFVSRKQVPEIFFSFDNVVFKKISVLFKKGLAFQAFPLGNALLYQGNIIVVQSILGSVAVVLFSTARTLVRTINQLMEMINQIIWPELSIFFGKNNLVGAAKLHRRGVLVSVVASSLCVAVLSVVGTPLFKMWTGKAVPFTHDLLILFLLPIPFNALWFTSSVVHVACNKHEGLAIRYLLSCSASIIFCFILTKFIGVSGAAFSTVIGDIILIPYVLRQSLVLTNDTFANFCMSFKNDFNFVLDRILKRNVYLK